MGHVTRTDMTGMPSALPRGSEVNRTVVMTRELLVPAMMQLWRGRVSGLRARQRPCRGAAHRETKLIAKPREREARTPRLSMTKPGGQRGRASQGGGRRHTLRGPHGPTTKP